MPDPFSTLPLPLPLIIFEAIEDFSTLNYLLQSSPAANIIFAKYYGTIAEAVLFNLAPELQRLLRTIVHIRSDRLSIGGKLTSPEALDSFLNTRVLNDAAGDEPLSNATVSLAAVRSLIKSASHVQQSASSFFREYLDRKNSVKPFYLSDNSSYFNDFHISLFEKIANDNIAKYPDGCCPGQVYSIVPSWFEEQRVCQALWRLQLYFDLLTIARTGPGVTSPVWNLLKCLGPHRVWSKLKLRGELGQIGCVYGFLCERFDATRMPQAPRSHLSELPTTNPKFLAPKLKPYLANDIWQYMHPDKNIKRPSQRSADPRSSALLIHAIPAAFFLL